MRGQIFQICERSTNFPKQLQPQSRSGGALGRTAHSRPQAKRSCSLPAVWPLANDLVLHRCIPMWPLQGAQYFIMCNTHTQDSSLYRLIAHTCLHACVCAYYILRAHCGLYCVIYTYMSVPGPRWPMCTIHTYVHTCCFSFKCTQGCTHQTRTAM